MKKTKILTVLSVLLAMGITACGANSSESGKPSEEKPVSQPSDNPTSKDDQSSESQHKHSYGEWNQTKAPTCTEEGEKERVCECGDKQTEKIPALGHTFAEGAEEYIQDGVKYLECSVCKAAAALEWAAKDYVAEESVMEATASDGSIRFTSNPTAANSTNDGIVEKSYAVYKIQLHKAVEHAGLDFDIQPSSYNVAIFDTVENDQKPGKDLVNGEIVTSAHRYALYVNGERVELGEDPGASADRGWFSWPVDFALKKGENTIKIVCMGGYRAKMYNFRLSNIPVYEHAHEYGAKVVENAAGEGFIASETMACTLNCGKTAIKWSALDYDATKTAERSDVDKGPESRDSGKAIRFSSQVSGSGTDHVNKGTHIVFNVKTPAAENVGLAMYSTSRNDVATAFDKFESDTAAGYEQINGEWVRPASRYGLKVDGQLHMLEANGEGWHGTGWYQFPVVIPSLTAGIHEIEVFNYGGYRVDMYNFMLTGFPAVEGSVFTLGEEWQSDANGHWKEVTGQDGVKFVYAEHKLVSDTSKTDVAPTCTEAGKAFKKCSVCGKEVEEVVQAKGHNYVEDTTQYVAPTCTATGKKVEKCSVCNDVKETTLDKIEHTWVGGEVTAEGTKGTQTLTCSVCNETKTVTGGIYGTFLWTDALQSGGTSLASDGKVNQGSYDLVVLSVPTAGKYVVSLNMQGSNGNGSKVLGSDGQRFAISANGVDGTFLGQGKTYAEFFGENQTTWVDVAFGEVDLVAGYNVIRVSALNGYYRTKINAAGNVTVAAKAAE